MSKRPYRIILSGGGTGGHIFPAISIADEFVRRYPDTQVLFVGAEGRMEMTRVPEAGYQIKGLPIAGLVRSFTLKNLLFPFKVVSSLAKARSVVKEFKPDVVIGTGGYASAPVLFAASLMGIPTLIQEQNGFAGLTNKILARRAKKVCVAYRGLEDVFPKHKIVLTGNPVRLSISDSSIDQHQAKQIFGLDPNRKTILALGGSLGANAINNAIFKTLDMLIENDTQIVWQCGKVYCEKYEAKLREKEAANPNRKYSQYVHLVPFIKDMNLAYSAADIIISRAGAATISELCLVGKPAVLVPSPNVAEDHQRHNAMALSTMSAAVLIVESEDLPVDLSWQIRRLLGDDMLCDNLSKNIKALARANATSDIVDQVEKLLPAL